MHALNDVHQQFAEYFNVPALRPYAWLLSKKLSEGHICLHLDSITDIAAELPAYYTITQPGSQPLETLPLVGKQGDDSHPFVLYQHRLYLQRYYRYETTVLQRIQLLLSTEKEQFDSRLTLLQQQQALIAALFKKPAEPAGPVTAEEAIDWQLAAAITGLLHNFTIITGGPGTGKTTTVAKILAILYATNPDLKVALAAPTGKAAARMAESLRNTKLPVDNSIIEKFQALSPATLHRLLRPIAGTPYFRHDENNPLGYDVVIVDECSMIDVALFSKLLSAIAPGTRLILLGDKDQLASVEAGSLFGDLCLAQPMNLFTSLRRVLINSFITETLHQLPDSYIENDEEHSLFQHLVELRRSHRFTGQSGIGQFSKAIIKNDLPVLEQFLQSNADEQVIIDPAYSNDLFEQFVAGYQAFMAEKDIRTALQKMNALRVLCAVREGEQGLYATNKRIEKYLYDKDLLQPNTAFYENRPIILTRNYYEHGLFNGDTGIIRRNAEDQLMAWFEDSTGELKAVMPGYLSEAETVFAMTIHKSQGSEFEQVLVLLPQTTEVALLTRELLYTAVTRAKKRVYLQGSADTIKLAAQRMVERASGIAARFQTA
jgi:exodeoxyribonuclease V alpha subunit